MRHRLLSPLLLALLLPLLAPPAVQALPYVLPLPANAKAGVEITGTEADGVLQIRLSFDEKGIGSKISSARLTVTDQIAGGKFREIIDLEVGLFRDKAGKLVADFSLERKLAAAASISLVLDQEKDVPGGTWYIFALDDHLDLFNDLPEWKLRQKLRRYANTAPARGNELELTPQVIEKLEKRPSIAPAPEKPKSIEPGAGLLGPTFIDGKPAGIVFQYTHGRVVQHEVIEASLVKKTDLPLPARGVEIVFEGELHVTRPTKVKVWHAGGSVSHGVHTLHVAGSELGSVGDDRQKSAIYELKLAKGAHAVKWILGGGRFGNSLLRFEDSQTGELLPLSFSAEQVKPIAALSAGEVVVITSKERGWPIPTGW